MAKATKAKKPTLTKEDVAAQQAAHPTMMWFDIFEVEPVTATFPRGTEIMPVISGYNLIKKLVPVFIERHLAMGNGDVPGFNHFAIGNDHGAKGGMAKMYLPKDKYSRGDNLPWRKLAALIPLRQNHPYTVRLKEFEAWEKTSAFENAYEQEEEEETEE